MGLLVVLFFFLSVYCNKEISKKKKVLLFGLSGIRTDCLKQANTPNFDSIKEDYQESFVTHHSACILPSLSGPNWISLLCGVGPDKSGVYDDTFYGSRLDKYPHIFKYIKEWDNTKQLISISNWEGISDNIVTNANKNVGGVSDYEVLREALEILYENETAVDLMFLFLDDTNSIGVDYGFYCNNEKYIKMIEEKDSNLGEIRQAIQKRTEDFHEEWLILVVSDHGGIGLDHQVNKKEVRTTFIYSTIDFHNITHSSKPCEKPYEESCKTTTKILAPSTINRIIIKYLGIQYNEEWDWDENVFNKVVYDLPEWLQIIYITLLVSAGMTIVLFVVCTIFWASEIIRCILLKKKKVKELHNPTKYEEEEKTESEKIQLI